MTAEYAVQMRGITKRFPGVVANDNVSFEVKRGEIHALLGENGAGKSTLMNMLGGLYRPDQGEITINGEAVYFSSPRDAIKKGIGMVHQHFMLVPTQTVAENMVIGASTGFWLSPKKLYADIAAVSERYNLPIAPDAKIWQLSVGEQQRVEILKTLYLGAKILIMDEPTAVLTPQEVEKMFVTLREMTKNGHTIIFISHKLDEVLSIADRITVLQKGKVSANVAAKDVNKAELAKLMVGREVLFRIDKEAAKPKDDVLVLKNVSANNDRGLPALRSLSLNVRAGEIVGIAGVSGNGQHELAETLTGLRHVTDGVIEINNTGIQNQPPLAAIDQKVAHIPADRNGMGSAPTLSLSDNLIMKSYRAAPVRKGWRLLNAVARNTSEDLIKQYNVATPSIDVEARLLSGGNLQKLILAREISAEPTSIVAVTPTRGLDVGATEAVHQRLISERDRGAAVLLISEDLDELLSLSDRILVMYEGQIVGELPPDEDRIDEIGLLMAGGVQEAQA